MKNPLVALLVLLTLAYTGSAQSHKDYIPNESFVVTTLKKNNIKVDFSEYQGLEFGKFTNLSAYKYELQFKTFNQAINKPNDIGVNPNEDIYYFNASYDSLSIIGYVIKLDQSQKFAQYYDQLLDEKEGYEGEPSIYKSEYKGFRYVSNQKSITAYDDKTVLLLQISWDPHKDQVIDYSDPNYYDKIQKQEQIFQVKRAKALESKMKDIIDQKTKIKTNPNYQLFERENFDVGYWFNFSMFEKEMMSKLADMPNMYFGMLGKIEDFRQLVKDNYLHFLIKFDDEEVRFTAKQYMLEEMQETYKSITEDRVNPRFFDYIDAKNLMGLYTLAINPNKLYDATSKFYKLFFEKGGKQGEIAKAVTDVLGIFIDEEDILGLFKGDIVVAVTDVKPLMVSYYEREYDGDTYVGRVEKQKAKNQAVFVSMVGINNVENVNKILKLLDVTDVAIKKGDYYEIKKAKELPIFVSIKNDILFVTNDIYFIQKTIKKGVKKRKRVHRDLQSLTKNNFNVIYFDFNKIVEILQQDLKHTSQSDKIEMESFRHLVEDLTMKGIDFKNGAFVYDATLRFKKGTGYSLKSMLDHIKDSNAKKKAYRKKRRSTRTHDVKESENAVDAVREAADNRVEPVAPAEEAAREATEPDKK